MANITFSEASGVADSIYGNSQAPISRIIMKRGEACEQESIAKLIFHESPSKKWAEKSTSLTAMDGFQPVGENGEYPETGMRESYSKTIEHTTWKNSFDISREMIDDTNFPEIVKEASKFTASYYRTRERFGASLIGGAMNLLSSVKFGGKTFDVTTADGKTLFSSSHPSILKKANQSNLFAEEFSVDALSAAECAMQNFRGDNDEILDITPDTILIPNNYALKKKVFEAIGADKDPATANNGFNYQFGRWNVIVWSYLGDFVESKSTRWSLMDSRFNEEYDGAVWYNRVNLDVRSEIASNDANKWKGYARFSAGFCDWRFACLGGAEGGTSLLA